MELNYKEFGTGEPVVILHGLFGTLDNWQTIAKKLAEEYTVFILDLPNHGRSPHTEGEIDYEMMADALAEFMLDHWIYETRIIGHSMGGKLAMQFALSHPHIVKKLAVIDIAPRLYRSGHEDVFNALFAVNLATLQDRKEAEAILMDKLNGDVGTVQFLLKNLTRNNPFNSTDNTEGGGFEWKMNLQGLFDNYNNILQAPVGEPFEKPTLFIRGGESKYIKDADFATIKQLFPKAQIETIEGAGHWVHADKPRELTTLLHRFLMSEIY
ncbi:MAG: alpha/beta fold hydrolase [Saprospiraceae bacterium]|nr:alpha/beta fold hydrolase [Saprospiraceae bacterium]